MIIEILQEHYILPRLSDPPSLIFVTLLMKVCLEATQSFTLFCQHM